MPDAASASTYTRAIAPEGTRAARSRVVTTARMPESLTMNASRSRGYAGSSDTYAPPALRIPRMPTIASGDRPRQMPTGTSGPTPRRRSLAASASARLLSSRYGSSTDPLCNATASGVAAAWASNNSCRQSVDSSAPPPVLHCSSRMCRSSSLTRGIPWSDTPSLIARFLTNVENRCTIASMESRHASPNTATPSLPSRGNRMTRSWPESA